MRKAVDRDPRTLGSVGKGFQARKSVSDGEEMRKRRSRGPKKGREAREKKEFVGKERFRILHSGYYVGPFLLTSVAKTVIHVRGGV